MPSAPLPSNEAERLAALQSYDILDTACEASFDNIATLASMITECPIALISLVDSNRQCFKARVGLEATETARDVSFCAHAILKPSEMLIVRDATLDPRFQDNPVVADMGIRFYAGAPLVTQDGAALGTLCVADFVPRDLTATQNTALSFLAGNVMTTLELRRAMKLARTSALTDAVTGIANRPALRDALERAIACQKREGTPFSLVYIDLDGFKRVNDVHGHATGDRVLRLVAETLTDSIRAADIPARLGGDEFAVVLAGKDVDAATAAERIRQRIEGAMAQSGRAVTASVGAVTFHSAPATVEDALSAADKMMYGAKVSGKNQVRHQEIAYKILCHE